MFSTIIVDFVLQASGMRRFLKGKSGIGLSGARARKVRYRNPGWNVKLFASKCRFLYRGGLPYFMLPGFEV
jgi:hypothetical protein